MTRLAAAVLALALAGCGGGFRLVRPGKAVSLGYYSVDPQISWTVSANRKWQAWTVDGYYLHRISFSSGLREGDVLFGRLEGEAGAPTFKAGLTPHEIMEFVAASYAALGYKQVKTAGLKPHPFGRLEGFRFELESFDRFDLEVRALVVGAVEDHKLYAICYDGASEYYFPKYRETVERLIASIQIP